ncbi:unnamed protein product [Rhizophagus irregularis]|nr:unnamed protein product [Rhizophagus irregularis]
MSKLRNSCCEEVPAEAIKRASKAFTLVQNEKKSPLIIDFWKTIISVQKRKLVDSVECIVLLNELTTSAIRSTLQNDINQVHLVRENVTNCLKYYRDEEETERASTRLKKSKTKADSQKSANKAPTSINTKQELYSQIACGINITASLPDDINKIVSGKEFGEINNEAHNDRTYNINYDQKSSNSGCVPKNDALARNSVNDLNYYFTQYANCTTATAKTFKSVSIHGYKYNVSVYVTDIIRIKTYRIYEVFSFRIPTSYSEGWNLFDIAKFGALLEELLINRQDVKSKMSKENVLNNNETNSVQNWISVSDNSSQKK